MDLGNRDGRLLHREYLDGLIPMRTIILLLASSAALFGQSISTTTANHLRHGATLPATCIVANGDVFFKTAATIGAYQCLTTNTWTAMSAGAAGVTTTAGATFGAFTYDFSLSTLTPPASLCGTGLVKSGSACIVDTSISNANYARINAASTYGAFFQDFSLASMAFPSASGAALTTANRISYDSTNNILNWGDGTSARYVPTFGTNAQTSTYQVTALDFKICRTIPVASGTFTITLVASGSQPADGQCINILNYGSGVVTVARSGQNINGAAANLTMAAGSASAPTGLHVWSNASHYLAQPIGGSSAATSVVDSNGNSVLLPIATASAVNQFSFTNGAAGSPATVTASATGSSTDIDIKIIPKGAGVQYHAGTAAWTTAAGNHYANQYNPNDNASYSIQQGGAWFFRDIQIFQWTNSSVFYGTVDTGLTRNAAGVIEINNGTAGTYRDLQARNLLASGKAINYNNIATVSNGVPAEYATIDLTAQTAAIAGGTALYTPAATGMFRISYYAKVTTAGTTSILGGTTGLVLAYTDGSDSVAQTGFTMPEDNQAGAALSVGTGNTTNTNQAVIHGSAVIFALTGVPITYAFGYTSTGTAMQYELHIKVEAL